MQDAYFYAGSEGAPSGRGFLIPNEKGSDDILKVNCNIFPLFKKKNLHKNMFLSQRYRKRDIVLTLPSGKTLKDIKWLSVWCR